MKLTNDRRTQVYGFPVPRHCSSMDARTKLPIKDSVDVCRGVFRVVRKKLVDGLLYLGKTSSGILELEKFLDAEELTTFEDCLVLVVNNDVAIRRVRLADKDKSDAELPLHCCRQFLLVGRQVAVLLQRVTLIVAHLNL